MPRISKSILAKLQPWQRIFSILTSTHKILLHHWKKTAKYFLRDIMPTQPILGDKLTHFFVFVQQTLQQFQRFKNYTNTTYQIHCTSPIIASISHVQITITSVQLTFLSLDFGLCGVWLSFFFFLFLHSHSG
jgi:hypothetical protein